MNKAKQVFLGILAMLVLAACQTPVERINASGKLSIQSIQPNVLAGCPVRAGDWMALEGNDFGEPADWGEGGPNYVRFPPEPGIDAEQVELTKVEDPATLFFKVPAGAQSGTVKLHVEDVGDATFEVVVEGGTGGANVVPGCRLPEPPPAE